MCKYRKLVVVIISVTKTHHLYVIQNSLFQYLTLNCKLILSRRKESRESRLKDGNEKGVGGGSWGRGRKEKNK